MTANLCVVMVLEGLWECVLLSCVLSWCCSVGGGAVGVWAVLRVPDAAVQGYTQPAGEVRWNYSPHNAPVHKHCLHLATQSEVALVSFNNNVNGNLMIPDVDE